MKLLIRADFLLFTGWAENLNKLDNKVGPHSFFLFRDS